MCARRNAIMSSGVATPMAASSALTWSSIRFGHRMRDVRAVAPGDRVLALDEVDRAVLDDAGGVGDPFGQHALERLQRQRARRPQQHPQRLAAHEAPAEDVVFALPGGQRLVRLQIVHPGRVAAARGQQPLAQHARLHRAHDPQPRLPARACGRRARAAWDPRAAPPAPCRAVRRTAAPPSGPPAAALAAIIFSTQAASCSACSYSRRARSRSR